MGLFNKKKKEEKIPSLPELPKLPELPNLDLEKEHTPNELTSQLPSFPNNKIGEKFSQSSIKEAVAGEKEEKEVLDEFGPEEAQGIPKPLSKPIPPEFEAAATTIRREPVFIRLDKFEESMQVFNKAKEKITEIEKLLRDTKRIKEEEEGELENWEKEIQSIKSQIEKVDKDIFSKIE